MFSIIHSIVLAIIDNGTCPCQNDTITIKDEIGWMISLISAGAAATGLIFTAKTFSADANARFVQSLSIIDKEIFEIEKDTKITAAIGSPVRIEWEIDYLNVIDKIAYLIKKGKHPKEYQDYFKRNFQWARALIQLDITRATDYEDILSICKDKNWQSIMYG